MVLENIFTFARKAPTQTIDVASLGRCVHVVVHPQRSQLGPEVNPIRDDKKRKQSLNIIRNMQTAANKLEEQGIPAIINTYDPYNKGFNKDDLFVHNNGRKTFNHHYQSLFYDGGHPGYFRAREDEENDYFAASYVTEDTTSKFDTFLKEQKINTLIMSGLFLYWCLQDMGLNALTKGYNVIILQDCAIAPRIIGKGCVPADYDFLELDKAGAIRMSSTDLVKNLQNQTFQQKKQAIQLTN